jgi:hypothetical protein
VRVLEDFEGFYRYLLKQDSDIEREKEREIAGGHQRDEKISSFKLKIGTGQKA